jgi:hypothetical protein
MALAMTVQSVSNDWLLKYMFREVRTETFSSENFQALIAALCPKPHFTLCPIKFLVRLVQNFIDLFDRLKHVL